MAVDRRAVLQVLAGTGAAAVAPAPAAAASARREAPPDAVGLLYDATRCIGCKACVAACAEANDLEPDRSGIPGGLYQAPTDLNARTKNLIKLYRDGDRVSYVKVQCMHCIDPACAAACMIGALQKREHGIVTWEPSRCIGCRYCQAVCPFDVPKFEWSKSNPHIVKCELCRERLADGRQPACSEVCPRQAVVFGRRDELLAEARRRLAEAPGRYVDRIYGEREGGGTQVLYLAAVPFDKLGLPDLGDASAPQVARTVQHGVYQGFVAPVVLYALLGGVMWRNRRTSAGPTASPRGSEEDAP
jgi:formate dehydrogenase beta subunit